MKHFRLSTIVATLSALCYSSFSYAAAFQFYEVGTPINGAAAVGQTVVNDASIAFYNPAGMTALPTSELLLGVQGILPYTNFSPNSSTTISGTNGGSAGVMTPGFGGYFSYKAMPKLSLGLSLNTPYGGALNYENHWVGRYDVQQITFYAVDLIPSIAYQVTDWFSVGGGVIVEYAYINQTVAVPNSPTVDGQADLQFDNTSPGFDLGVLVTPTRSTKLGLLYRSQVIHDFRGSIDFLNLSIAPSATTKMTMPATVTASIAQDINSQWAILGELGWANWSSMVNNVVQVNNLSAVTQQDWHDTYRVGLAGQYRPLTPLMVQAGISYDSSPTSSSKRTPQLPMDRQIRVGAGLEYAIIKPVTLGVSYEYINLGTASINSTSPFGTFAGSYDRNYANVFQASLNVNC